ncbi:MAG: hypothetical protein R3189_00720 [Thiomicrorhabdus chilensis]|uniref:hypothetical protein n=1 Tax=Thiomicrorhabdus chilensis TaxID=63656 RepID=UPI00299CDBA9|nr:hypothetical protein [Thiomicrorhabdus chilensis]MDX1346750.1 hypothetical protein [Thiomicrorhabdus chilensis]
MFRLWILVVVMTIISWFVLRLVNKPTHIAWVFLFWVAAIMGATLLLYGLSVWFTSQQS